MNLGLVLDCRICRLIQAAMNEENHRESLGLQVSGSSPPDAMSRHTSSVALGRDLRPGAGIIFSGEAVQRVSVIALYVEAPGY